MEKKKGKKKRGKKRLIITVVCICLLFGATGIFFWQKRVAATSENGVAIAAGENEEIIYAQVENIVGNDLEVSIVTPVETVENDTETAQAEGMTSESGIPDFDGENNFSRNGEQSGFSGRMQGDIPEGFSGEFPDGMPGRQGTSETSPSYTSTGETRNYEVPVGTEVITKLGVVTSFSRLSAGNIIAVLMEEGTDNILKIWVVS